MLKIQKAKEKIIQSKTKLKNLYIKIKGKKQKVKKTKIIPWDKFRK